MDRRARWLALIVLCLGDLMIVLDGTIVNVALPSIRDDLGFTETSLAWVVNAYLLTFGGFLLLGGRLGDLFGQRRMFLIGIALFTAASLACGLAGTQGLLVAARAVQGFGGALVSAVALSLIMTLFTEPAERAKAMGIFGFVLSGGGTAGVLLGGVLTDLLSWHWIFLVNIPVGVVVYLLSLRLLPTARGAAEGGRLDVWGAVTVTAALMLAVFAIVDGNEAGWGSARTLGLLGGAVVMLIAFLVIESRVTSPLVPLGLFRIRNVASANVVGVLMAGGLFAWFFFSALYLQQILGFTPLEVGLAYLPSMIIWGGCSLISDRIVMRFGITAPLVAGLGLMAVGLLLFARTPVDGSLALDVIPGTVVDRPRRRHRLQPHPARGHERRRADRVRPGIGDREHLVHDGRRARPGGARQRGRGAHRQPHLVGRARAGGAERRLPPRLHGRRRLHARRGAGRRGLHTRGGAVAGGRAGGGGHGSRAALMRRPRGQAAGSPPSPPCACSKPRATAVWARSMTA